MVIVVALKQGWGVSSLPPYTARGIIWSGPAKAATGGTQN